MDISTAFFQRLGHGHIKMGFGVIPKEILPALGSRLPAV